MPAQCKSLKPLAWLPACQEHLGNLLDFEYLWQDFRSTLLFSLRKGLHLGLKFSADAGAKAFQKSNYREPYFVTTSCPLIFQEQLHMYMCIWVIHRGTHEQQLLLNKEVQQYLSI